VSVGASLSHVHVPGRAPPNPNDSDAILGSEEIEVGMGIHNEPGSHRVRAQLPQLVKTMLAQLLDVTDEDRAFLEISAEDRVVLLVNNLGGVSALELGGITAEIVGQLKADYGIEPVRILAGTYMTSLNGLGFSITLMKVADTGLGQEYSMLGLLDAPAEATGWSAAVTTETWTRRPTLTWESKVGGLEEVQPSGLKCAQYSIELFRGHGILTI
jgi:dihydroxyacetone kinase